jgi:hypothetical protein
VQTVGEPGALKTFFMLDAGLSIASGQTDFFGYPVVKQGAAPRTGARRANEPILVAPGGARGARNTIAENRARNINATTRTAFLVGIIDDAAIQPARDR